MASNNGGIRIRVVSAEAGFPAIGNDTVAEYFHDGEWHRLRGLMRASIEIRQDRLVEAHMEVELNEAEVDALPTSLKNVYVDSNVDK